MSTMKQTAEELGGTVIQSEQEQEGMKVETHLSDPFICFWEVRKTFPEQSDPSVLHITIRDMDEENGIRRVAKTIKQLTGLEMGNDWHMADTPKYGGGGGGGGGKNKPQRVAPPEDGWFAIKSVMRKLTSNGSNMLTVRGDAPEGNYYEASAWDKIVDATFPLETWREDLKEKEWTDSKDPKHTLWAEVTKVEKDGRTFYNVKGFKKTLTGERPI